MKYLLNTLRKFDALRDGDVVNQETVRAIPPTYADGSVFDCLSPNLVHALRKSGIEHLYQHQSEAILKALDGANVVLQAPTASGKSLAFQVPMLETLIREANSHALMLYPNKALALDQRDQLLSFGDLHDVRGRKIESWFYDGDTTKESREVVRKSPPKIIITNPDMLHLSFLGHAELWQRFFEGLKWVIVDEIHEYRGYFGSNVSLILRRFSHHLAQRGVHSQFFSCSATCANAGEHAHNLTGLTFAEVNASDSMRPQRHFYFIKPDIPDFKYWDILQVRTVKAGLACLASGKSVLVFCPTRKFAEACLLIASREIPDLDVIGITPEMVKVFRGGLSADERRDILNGLKKGLVRLVFATNALELGIDIGGLDGVILAGFPDSIMSAWQRIGRAGRSWESEAFVMYYARNNPLDQFYADNLKTFLGKSFDVLVVNPGNEDLIKKHVPSLLYETPDLEGGSTILGEAFHSAAVAKQKSGAKPPRSGSFRPHFGLNIRGSGSGSFKLKVGQQEIGTLSSQQVFREAYERAIYLHGGRKYRVVGISFTGSGGEVALARAEQHSTTKATIFTRVSEQDIYDGREWVSENTEVDVFYGKVLITEKLTSVVEIDDRGEVTNQWMPQTNLARFDNAHAFWMDMRATHSSKVDVGIPALQHLFRVGAGFSIPLDAHDIFPHVVVKDHKVYIVETYPGGIGIASKIMEQWRDILRTGIGVAKLCRCLEGCPGCIVPPRSHSQEELDKGAGILLARSLLRATEGPPDFRFNNNLWEPV